MCIVKTPIRSVSSSFISSKLIDLRLNSVSTSCSRRGIFGSKSGAWKWQTRAWPASSTKLASGFAPISLRQAVDLTFWSHLKRLCSALIRYLTPITEADYSSNQATRGSRISTMSGSHLGKNIKTSCGGIEILLQNAPQSEASWRSMTKRWMFGSMGRSREK